MISELLKLYKLILLSKPQEIIKSVLGIFKIEVTPAECMFILERIVQLTVDQRIIEQHLKSDPERRISRYEDKQQIAD